MELKETLSQTRFRQYLIESGYSANTIRTYLYQFRKFISAGDPSTYIYGRDNPVYRSFLKALQECFKINLDIPKQKGRKARKLPDVISYEEYLKLIDYIKDVGSKRDLIMVRMLFEGAFRCSELLNVRKQDIDFINRTVKVVHGKGKKQRYVFISSETVRLLLDYVKDLKPDERLFKISDRHFRRLLNKYSLMALNKKISPHTLRHSCATFLRRQGFNLEEIQEYLGHSNITTTTIYLHISRPELERKIREIFS